MGHMLPAAPDTQRKPDNAANDAMDPQAEAAPTSSSGGAASYHANGPKPPPQTGFNDAPARSASEMAYEEAHPALHDAAAAARRYNDAHPEFVARFNAATNNVCVIDGDVDIAAVKNHQANWGVAADGKIGPKTVDAAERLGHTIGVASADGIAMTTAMVRDEDKPAANTVASADPNKGTVTDDDRKWALSQLE